MYFPAGEYLRGELQAVNTELDLPVSPTHVTLRPQTSTVVAVKLKVHVAHEKLLYTYFSMLYL